VLWPLTGRSARGGPSARSASSYAYAPHCAGAAVVAWWLVAWFPAGAWQFAPTARAGLCHGRAPARWTTPLWLWGRRVDAHLAGRGHCRLAPGVPGLCAGAAARGAVDTALAGIVHAPGQQILCG